MYKPSHFDETRLPVLHALMQRHPLAALVANTPAGLEANHIPLLLDGTRGPFGTLRGHVARANTLWSVVAPGAEILAIFQGANHYVSPTWYPSKQQHGKVVPTWNYAVVHARGAIEWFHDAAWLRGLVEVTTARHEAQQPRPWQVSDAPDPYIGQMLGAIVGFEIAIRELSGKWKVSQNRDAADRAGVSAALERSPDASAREMAALIDGAGPEGAS